MNRIAWWSAWSGCGLGILLNMRVAMKPPIALPTLEAERHSVTPIVFSNGKGLSRDSLARALTGRDPFRLDRRTAVNRYRIPVSPLLGVPAPPPKPALRLVGMVGGSTPSAILEGLPGVGGPQVVRAGDVVGQLRVVGITATEVRVSGMDTVWTLTVVRPWK